MLQRFVLWRSECWMGAAACVHLCTHCSHTLGVLWVITEPNVRKKSLMYRRPPFRTVAPLRITLETYSRFLAAALLNCASTSLLISLCEILFFFFLILPTGVTLWRIGLGINHFQTGWESWRRLGTTNIKGADGSSPGRLRRNKSRPSRQPLSWNSKAEN